MTLVRRLVGIMLFMIRIVVGDPFVITLLFRKTLAMQLMCITIACGSKVKIVSTGVEGASVGSVIAGIIGTPVALHPLYYLFRPYQIFRLCGFLRQRRPHRLTKIMGFLAKNQEFRQSGPDDRTISGCQATHLCNWVCCVAVFRMERFCGPF